MTHVFSPQPATPMRYLLIICIFTLYLLGASQQGASQQGAPSSTSSNLAMPESDNESDASEKITSARTMIMETRDLYSDTWVASDALGRLMPTHDEVGSVKDDQRRVVGMNGTQFIVDFKWADNPGDLNDPISLATSGDTAPNRRFNYRFIWGQN